MLNFLPGPIKGVVALIFLCINTLFWCIPLFVFAFVKAVLPLNGWRKICDKILNGIANNWIFCNNEGLKVLKKIEWDITGLENLKNNEWYLVISNHQTWVDIIVLQKTLYKKIPFLKFFLKKELIWVPVLGTAWWALDFPFMKRYTEAFLKKKPHLRGKDLEITKKACEKFKTIPVSVMNFVEGTRFTVEKHKKQLSPYKNLLKPKSGGIAYVLSALGEYLHSIVDVTISYPDGVETFWQFLCSVKTRIKVKIDVLPINEKHVGDYFNDEKFRAAFNDWLNSYWAAKDKTLNEILAQFTA
ncbi:MAG: acyltransferase [Spirochaetes bacterium]|nr:acyltransferase [Spirochaetota bacterium]